MKKTLLIIAVLLLVGASYMFVSSYYIIQKTDISILNKCHITKMNQVSLCPGNSNYTSLKLVSKHFKNLVVIAEDSSFYSHKGFDWYELKESFKTNLRALSYLRGGSTITQQLVKNVFLTPTKSLQRKFIEAMLAKKIEQSFSKNQILERYINVIEFGKNIYGITHAAQHYFNKSPHQLNELESAFLVYLIPSPKKYSQVFKNKQLTTWAHKRITSLLRKLKNFKKISEDRFTQLKPKVKNFPWQEKTALPLHSLESIYEVDEEKIQEEISQEIKKELSEENFIIDE